MKHTDHYLFSSLDVLFLRLSRIIVVPKMMNQQKNA